MSTSVRAVIRQKGISLVELIMFIVIVGLAMTGILSVMNVTSKASADPMLRKQAIAIGESLLEEIELQAFTFCLPSDANASSATSTAGCTGGAANSEDVLPASARVSNAAGTPRIANNVADYHTLDLPTTIYDISGNAVGTTGYTAKVLISQVGAAVFGLPAANNNDALQIDVTVKDPAANTILLTGYRLRYAPRAVP
ncbi:type II secretion system protein [Undibacterium sp. Jales W-56]|uniref:type IV pilus modification PilV family protein n=1 Tax=Undibacterium sp. Jales W-56 TaxID=2897325 RepID=UPI0021D20962|nr:type II secretion system protein [Undibacterium sp. Jales W-56]MCU6432695.1 type II secretion system protein [Undibacterium sp. Jales W-56]